MMSLSDEPSPTSPASRVSLVLEALTLDNPTHVAYEEASDGTGLLI